MARKCAVYGRQALGNLGFDVTPHQSGSVSMQPVSMSVNLKGLIILIKDTCASLQAAEYAPEVLSRAVKSTLQIRKSMVGAPLIPKLTRNRDTSTHVDGV